MRGRHQRNKVQLLEQNGLKVCRKNLDGVTSRFVSFSSEMKMVRMSLGIETGQVDRHYQLSWEVKHEASSF